MLGKLRIRGKLALVVALPLLAVAVLTLPGVTGAVERAQRAEEIRHSVDLANRITSLTSEVRQERLLSLGYLFDVVDRSRLVAQSSRVNDRVADIVLDAEAGQLAGGGLSIEVSAALAAAQALAELRVPVLARGALPEQVIAAYGNANHGLINSLQLVDEVDLATPGARQLAALDASMRLSEVASQATDLLLVLTATGNQSAGIQYLSTLQLLQEHTRRFEQYATPAQLVQLELMSEAYTARDETGVGLALGPDPWEITAGRTAAGSFPALDSLSQLGRFVEAKVITDALIDVDAQEQAARQTAYLVGAGAVLVVLAVVALTALLARAVVRPLLSLTGSAHRVAQVAEAELARIADDEAEQAGEPVRIEPIHAQGKDEIGDLGRAFDRVQSTAVQLVERQVASRQNVALMFGYLGRRTENLVSRQIALIDQLEQHETDPRRLGDLYRLDHISSRLRRNAGSLAALSGGVGADEYVAPLPLTDLVRLALGEIEDFSRVDVDVPANLVLAPAVVGDLMLVLAELMENATTFSPPHTRVSVSAVRIGSEAHITIVDHGIGMPETRLAEENARLARRERLDLAPTEVLGLFVVGRLSRRHGLTVTLSETDGGGVTALVEVPRQLLVETPRAPQGLLGPPAAADPPRAALRPGTTQTQPALPSLEAALVDVAALSKASRAVEAGRRWNAFAVPTVAPADSPANDDAPPMTSSPTVGQPAAPADHPSVPPAEPAESPSPTPAVALAEPPAIPAPARPAAPVPAPAATVTATAPVVATSAAAASERSGLRRRVPGATLRPPPTPARTTPTAAAQTSRDPDQARALIEQLEGGVARALSEIRSNSATEENQDDR